MAAYTTLDYLPDLTAGAMSGARALTFSPAAANQSGWDYEAIAFGSESYALLHSLYRFTAIEGATYDLFTVSYFDPYILLVYDALGNAIVANDERDDPVDFQLNDGGMYGQDVVFDWKAPYSGTFYIDASWHQGSYYTFYSLDLYEDRATATTVSNRPPVVASPLQDLNWTEGQSLYFDVPAGTFSDPDGNGLTLSARLSNGSPLPLWLTFDVATRKFQGTAPADFGDITVRVTATDPGGLSVFDDAVFHTPHASGGNGQVLTGTSGDDTLTGGKGDDTLNGGKGNDLLTGSAGNDSLYGGDGTDTALFSGGFADYMISFDSASNSYRVVDKVSGRDGADTLFGVELLRFSDGTRPAGGSSSNGMTLIGTAGADTLNGGSLDDRIEGNDGDDYLNGGGGNDTLYGGKGNDTFDWDKDGRGGVDTFYGESGNDTYVLSDPADRVVETPGNGDDMIWVPFDYSLANLTAVENLAGFGTGAMILTGNDLANQLSGSEGNDTLQGGKGDDRIDGRAGTDTAVFRGKFAEYSITSSSTGSTYTVVDKVAGRDGTDTLSGVEKFQFSDGTRSAAAVVIDWMAPTVVTYNPADGRSDVLSSTNLTLTFSEPIQRGTGSIVLRTGSGAVVETFNVSTSSNLFFSGPTLVVDPSQTLASGTRYVLEFAPGSVKDLAGNGYLGGASYDFSTRVADDFAGGPTTTGRLLIGQATTGAVETAEDTDWFAVELAAGRGYEFKVDGISLLDPQLALYSPGGSLLGWDDDSGAGLNALLSINASTSGTYFLQARGYLGTSGTYRISAAQIGSDDFTANASTSGRLPIGGSSFGDIESAGDVDWFAVLLNGGQTYRLQVTGSGLSDPLLGVVSPTGVVLATDDDSGEGLNSLVTFTAPISGTYFLSAASAPGPFAGTGRYVVSAQTQLGDDYSANTGTAGRLALGGTSSGRIETSGDKDWFAISLIASQTYQFMLNGGTLSDPALTIHSGTGTSLAFDDNGGGGLNAMIAFTPTASGIYYLAAGAASLQTGTYSLSATIVSGDDYAANASTSGRLLLGGSTLGHVESAGDVDWFAVTLTAGQGVRFQLDGTGLSDPILTLYSSVGAQLARDDDSGEGVNALINFTASSAGIYYLAAAGFGGQVGSYRVSASAQSIDDYGATTATSGRLSVGAASAGRIESSNDIDWFAVSLNAGQTYDFRMTATSPSDPRLTLHGGDGTALAGDDDGGGGLNALVSFRAPSSGTFFLGAQMEAGTTGNYNLAAQQRGAGDDGFSIRIEYTGDARFQNYFTQAAERWSEVITGDLSNVSDPVFGVIDDLLIDAKVLNIDGVGGILGRAASSAYRSPSDTGLPYKGFMQFDAEDLTAMSSNGTLFSVILHEIGHVLGISSSMFQGRGLVNGSNYIGTNGVAAYRQVTGNLGLVSIPLETGGGQGTALTHWSEDVFNTELMTGFAESRPPMPLSIITVGCLEDLGYGVNYAFADPFGF